MELMTNIIYLKRVISEKHVIDDFAATLVDQSTTQNVSIHN